MPGLRQYLITSLPALGELGTAPPINLVDLAAHVENAESAQAVVGVLLLSEDLLHREAFLAGEPVSLRPAVLTLPQVRGDEPLGDELATEEPGPARRIPGDALWGRFFHHAAEVALAYGSRFLAGWVRFEVSLRNALAAARARALQLDEAAYRVADDLGDPEEDFSALINEWAAAPTPLDGFRRLDQERWAWINANDAWFSFGDDELAAYAARLMLLHRWHRLGEPESSPGEPPG